jgi:integrase
VTTKVQSGSEYSSLDLTPLPALVFDRAGLPVDTSGDHWVFNSAEFRTINWSRVQALPESILYSLKLYAISRLERVSPNEAYNFCKDVMALFPAPSSWDKLIQVESSEIAQALFQHLVEMIKYLRDANRIYQFYRMREWYNWCVDMLPGHVAFNEEYAAELNLVHVPGNAKGEAVRTESLESGPLYDAEVEALRRALLQDTSTSHRHIMQRAALAVFLAFGRNPLNIMLLREGDIVSVVEGSSERVPEFLLRMPRIKKRNQGYRQEFRDCYLDSETMRFLSELIDVNRSIQTDDLPRPIFMRIKVDSRRLGTPMAEYAYHLDPIEFSSLLNEFCERLDVISSRTMKQLYLTPRRLRYTFATRMVAQGASAQALAKMLDHSDTQSVRVYFELVL